MDPALHTGLELVVFKAVSALLRRLIPRPSLPPVLVVPLPQLSAQNVPARCSVGLPLGFSYSDGRRCLATFIRMHLFSTDSNGDRSDFVYIRGGVPSP